MGFWIAVTAIATAVIAWFAYSNYRLVKEIKESREKHDQETRDLFQALVIAAIVGPSKAYDTVLIGIFKQYYKGKTKIFD